MNEAILMGFVRYVNEEKISEDFFCYYSLPENTTGEAIFCAIEEKIKQYGLDWANVIGLCTDGAPAMTGWKKGLAARIAEVANSEFQSSHCMLHREALAAKDASPELSATLKMCVKMINHIKANALNSRLFSLICADMDEEHKTLFFHTEVRWLSRGKMLSRLFELREEMKTFFEKAIAKLKPKKKTKNGEPQKVPTEKMFYEKLIDEKWMCTLAYLADIFGLLNEFNSSMQGMDMNCFEMWNKVEAMKNKLVFWAKEADASKFEMFVLTKALLHGNASLLKFLKPIIVDHLTKLTQKFEDYFPQKGDPRTKNLWIVNPFLNRKEPNLLTLSERNELIGKTELYDFKFFQFFVNELKLLCL